MTEQKASKSHVVATKLGGGGAGRPSETDAKATKQTIDFVVVIDFECTCEENNRDFVHEIIEFPAVLVDCRSGKFVDEFRAFVRPTEKPQLTDFCTKLTGVTQGDVDKAQPLPAVLDAFHAWLGKHGLVEVKSGDTIAQAKHSFACLTDGPWDLQNFMAPECKRKHIQRPRYFDEWVNVRWLFAEFWQCMRCNVEGMLERFRLKFEGRPHCGIDDTRNIARIASKLIESGCVLRINDGLDKAISVNWRAPGARKRERGGEGKSRGGDGDSSSAGSSQGKGKGSRAGGHTGVIGIGKRGKRPRIPRSPKHADGEAGAGAAAAAGGDAKAVVTVAAGAAKPMPAASAAAAPVYAAATTLEYVEGGSDGSGAAAGGRGRGHFGLDQRPRGAFGGSGGRGRGEDGEQRGRGRGRGRGS